jgi:anti-sigma factor RsiW
MTEIDDNTLMAYVDGELEAARFEQVDELVQRDERLQKRIAQIKASDAALRAAFDAPMKEDAPRTLVEAVRHRTSAGMAPTATVVPLQARRRSMSQYALPLAASLAFLGGLGVGSLLQRPGLPALLAPGTVDSRSQLARLLEMSPTGQRIADLQIVGTFLDRAHRACREVEQVGPAGQPNPIAAAIACRLPDGRWTVEGAARVVVADATASKGFVPSGAVSADALAALSSALGGGPLMPAADERRLIENAWQSK